MSDDSGAFRGKSCRRLEEILGAPGQDLAELLRRAAELHRAETVLRRSLPAPLGDHIRLARVDSERVVLRTDSSAWQTKLRFLLPQIEVLIRDRLGLPDTQIECRVGAARVASTQIKAPPDMSLKTSAHLRRTAERINNSALAQALERLARHGQR